MQTHCPHCDTQFRVTETQINAADGFVRCGVCKEVFNALEVASQYEHQQSSPIENADDDIEAKPETGDVGNEADQYLEVNPDDTQINFNATPATDKSRKDAFDFFDETVNESLPHVVPDHFREIHSYRPASIVSTVLWSIGILLLSATLCLEYIWFNRDQFSQITEFQTAITNICDQFECKNIALRDSSNLELVTRNVYSHPNEKNALIVDVTMKNNAKFAQPFPVLQIDFSDIRGDTVAARRFLPSDYLSIEETQTKQPLLLQPNTSASITLEILDPGKQAMTYEFNFL
jgi:predicted Zn finger-like uncharacterized protein